MRREFDPDGCAGDLACGAGRIVAVKDGIALIEAGYRYAAGGLAQSELAKRFVT